MLRLIPADLPESRQSVINMLSDIAEIKQHELETGAIGFCCSRGVRMGWLVVEGVFASSEIDVVDFFVFD